LPTQAVADLLAANANPLLHGILYPSVQGGEGKLNVVLFHKAARVQPLEIPKGREVSATLYHWTDDGPETNYWVSEEVPRASSESSPEPFDAPFLSRLHPLAIDDDDRDFTLKLDVKTLEVQHVSGINFTTESYPVSRHRFEKTDGKF
jgi:hypothetical protein